MWDATKENKKPKPARKRFSSSIFSATSKALTANSDRHSLDFKIRNPKDSSRYMNCRAQQDNCTISEMPIISFGLHFIQQWVSLMLDKQRAQSQGESLQNGWVLLMENHRELFLLLMALPCLPHQGQAGLAYPHSNHTCPGCRWEQLRHLKQHSVVEEGERYPHVMK